MDRNAFIKECFKLAEEKGFESSQLYFKWSKAFTLKVVDSEIGSFDLSDTASVSFKGIYQGKMGRCFSEVIDETTAAYLVDKAYEAALYIEDEDEVFIYEGDESYPSLNFYNESLDQVGLEEKMDYILGLEKSCLSEEGVAKLQEVSYSEHSSGSRLVNSLGLDISDTGNLATVVIYGTGVKDGRVYTAFHLNYGSDYDKLIQKNTEKAFARKLREQFGAEQVPSGAYKAVLSPDASCSLLDSFSSMFSADAVQKDLSLLKGRLGEKVAADEISIVDNPHLEEGLGSSNFDSDGVATKVKTLVEGGVLKTYLHNLKTAKKDGVKSTGNAAGSGVAPSNIYIEQGSINEEELLLQVGNGIYIRDFEGLHAGTSSISGDFSLQADGALIEDGKITRPFSQVVISGNYLELLKDCYLVGDNLEFPYGAVGSPSLAIRELRLAGKKTDA